MNIYSILGIATTVLSFLAFLGIVAWAYSKRRGPAFEEAANAPFALPDDDAGSASATYARSGGHERFHVGFLELVRHRRDARVDRLLRVAAAGDEQGEGRAGAAAGGGPGGKPVETTGHTWDGDLAEYNNPLPRWWMWLFWITIVFSLVYLVLYPGLGKFAGVLGWTSASALREGNRRSRREDEAALRQVSGDGPEGGRRGSARRGRWASGSSSTTARSATARTPAADRASRTCADTRLALRRRARRRSASRSPTAAWASCRRSGAALGDENVKDVVAYVRSLSGLPNDSLKAQLGKEVFVQNCAACHGRRRQGQRRRSARRISPTRSGSTTAPRRRSPRASTRAVTSASTPSTRRCRRTRTRWAPARSRSSPRTSGACRTTPARK